MRRTTPLLIVLAAAVSACRPLVMTPEARTVAVASDMTAVGSCKLRGEVFALAPFRSEAEPMNQLKIRARGIGADTLVVSHDDVGQTAGKDWKAKAFRCESIKPAEVVEARVGGGR
ncbi:MAG TPA: hypothetical protein VFS34_17330 [Thermoanaerobaculia bacterium]|nr:hypothetical protein [Thermoanaerobaculia bacterium]